MPYSIIKVSPRGYILTDDKGHIYNKTPRLFIERFNKGLEERVRRQAEFYKSFEVINCPNPTDLGMDNEP